jgi:hypothetical protein
MTLLKLESLARTTNFLINLRPPLLLKQVAGTFILTNVYMYYWHNLSYMAQFQLGPNLLSYVCVSVIVNKYIKQRLILGPRV